MPLHPNIKVHARLTPKLNFAAHQNGWAGLSELQLRSSTETALEDVELTLETDPPMIRPRSWRIARIPAGGTVAIEDRRLDVDADRLRRLTETITTTVRWTVRAGGAPAGAAQNSLDVLAADEWGGTAVTPALLAAFCVPNDPAVDAILGDAARLLSENHPDVQLDGYTQSRKDHVWAVAQAIYTAVAARRIAYASPPASFETNGQRVRLPERVLQAGVATCLDTSLLMAALLEQAKLNAVVALPESHALVGVWLTDQTFAGPFTKDPAALRKRADLDDLLLIETTLATGDPAPPFSEAVKAGRRALDHTGDAKYTGTVDIRRAREQQIRPLAVEIDTPRAKAAGACGTARPGPEQPPTALLQAGPQDTDEAAETPGRPAPGETADGRVDRWLRQLLDLSLRNRCNSNACEVTHAPPPQRQGDFRHPRIAQEADGTHVPRRARPMSCGLPA